MMRNIKNSHRLSKRPVGRASGRVPLAACLPVLEPGKVDKPALNCRVGPDLPSVASERVAPRRQVRTWPTPIIPAKAGIQRQTAAASHSCLFRHSRESGNPAHLAAAGNRFFPSSIYSCRSAFTLMEILAALAIFALGMVAAASLYPAALSIQKSTITASQAAQATRNARAVIMARKITLSDDDDINSFPYTLGDPPTGGPRNPYNNIYSLTGLGSGNPHIPFSGVVYPFDGYFFNGVGSNTSLAWSRVTRAYPNTTISGTGIKNGNASLYWLPFFRYMNTGTDTYFTKDDLSTITIYVAVLKAQQGKQYPSSVTNLDFPKIYWNKVGYTDPVTGITTNMPVMIHVPASRQNNSLNKIDVSIPSSLGYGLKDILHANDQILDNRGNIYVVKNVSVTGSASVITVTGLVPNYTNEPSDSPKRLQFIWMGLPYHPGGDNPVKNIFSISGGKAVKYVTP